MLKCLAARIFVKRPQILTNCRNAERTFTAETPKKDASSKKHTFNGTEIQSRVRVRRTRPNDVPHVLRFVREHARLAWPGLAAPPAQPQVVLCDYVARILAQGHSMLAEQQEPRIGLPTIRGLALCASLCPWDASSLEKWARCVQDTRSRNLMQFTAHCLRGPALHDKYKVHNILQVILIVPSNNLKSAEITSSLAKNTILRGKEVGFPIIRFDVSNDKIVESLERLKLKKEWQLCYEDLPDILRDTTFSENPVEALVDIKNKPAKEVINKNSFVIVYTAKTDETNPKLSINKKKMA